MLQSNLICSISIASNLHYKTHSGRTNHWDNQSHSLWSKIGQKPTRNIDMVKNYGGNDFVQRYVFKCARHKPNEDAHPQVSGSEFHSHGAE